MTIETNMVVSLNYKLTNHTTGEKIEETSTDNPMVFIYGVQSIIPEFESNIAGKKVGETFKFAIESKNAYGEKSADNHVAIPLTVFFREDGKLNTDEVYVGATLPMSDNQGNNMLGTILEMNEETLTMDFNHPLAGVDLHFEGEVLELRPASEEELAHGHVHGIHGHQH
ncbi:MAG: peptidylprolyl isomerase [Flavobacteriia bacterium]|jgi:FKBP-type peptidyl-prolyl cis-trans isomerase SlyD